MDFEKHLPEFRFCPLCGGGLHSRKIKEIEPPRLVCDRCSFVFYMDPKVVACTILELEGGVVLLKRAIEPRKGKWVFPGGYVDRGERIEDAALRETFEECGLQARIEDLLGIYSYPGYDSAVVVYSARFLSGRLIAGDETSEAGLFPIDRIPWEDLAFRSTVDALRDYITRKGERAEHEDTTREN